jgi:imidazolonepropionase-like amidohydrolase
MRPRRLLTLLLVPLFACVHATQPLADSQHYSMKLGANDAGGMTVTTTGNTSVIDYAFNDRGRGPKTHTVVTFDANGIPVALETTGNDYLKSPVAEHFSIANGVATWKNDAEAGSGPANGAFYASYNAPPQELATLANALLKAPDHRLPLLPAGEASIRKLTELDVAAGGKTRHVTAYEISGLTFTPYPVWLDDRNRLFADASSWAQLVQDGWMSVAPQLIKAQDDAQDVQVADIARRLTHKPANGLLVVTNARLFDPATQRVTPNATIVVRGNRIEAAGGGIPAPDGGTTIDANGKTVIPGLWDMHSHLGSVHGLLDIANGVTTARDLANDTDFLLAQRKKWDEGVAIGPRVLMAGIIDGPGPYAGPTKVLVSTEDEARKAVDRYADLGYVQVKIYSSVKPELVPVITRRAHERGLRVSGHVPAFMRAEDAVRAGYDEIQHANFLMLEFMPDVKETRTPARFTAPAERGAGLDWSSAEARAFFDLLKQHHTVIDPTLDVFEEMFVSRKGQMSPVYAAVADRLPAQVRRGFLGGGLPVPDGKDQLYRDSFKKMEELVAKLHGEGIPIVAGTDALPGFALQRELELYVQAGIPPAEVLRIATLGAATVMHREKELGSVEAGKLADFAIIDGDPTTNISDVRKVKTVVKDGKVFETAELYRELGVK